MGIPNILLIVGIIIILSLIITLIDAFNSKHNTTADMVSIITHYNGII